MHQDGELEIKTQEDPISDGYRRQACDTGGRINWHSDCYHVDGTPDSDLLLLGGVSEARPSRHNIYDRDNDLETAEDGS